jgi:hypothetical protein
MKTVDQRAGLKSAPGLVVEMEGRELKGVRWEREWDRNRDRGQGRGTNAVFTVMGEWEPRKEIKKRRLASVRDACKEVLIVNVAFENLCSMARGVTTLGPGRQTTSALVTDNCR